MNVNVNVNVRAYVKMDVHRCVCECVCARTCEMCIVHVHVVCIYLYVSTYLLGYVAPYSCLAVRVASYLVHTLQG